MAVTTRTLPWQPPKGGRGLVGTLQPAAVAVVGLLAALGAVTRPGATLVLGAVLAGGTWALVTHLHSDSAADLPGLPHPAVPATAALLSSAAVAGTATLGMPVIGILGVLVAAPVAVARWCSSGRPQAAHRYETRPGADEAALVDLLRMLSLEDLFEEWCRTGSPVDLDPAASAARTRLRCLLIAELGRRDPVGTRRWLLEAPDAPPEGYVTDRSDRAA